MAESPTNIVVMFSGGIASCVAAQRAIARFGAASTTLLFCDTKMEDEDTYRFIAEAEAWLDVPVTTIADGRTPWEVFRDRRFIGNPRADLCSRILKRELARTWIETHAEPGTVIALGIDACEQRRMPAIRQWWAPYPVEFPLLWPKPIDKDICRQLVRRAGLREPRLYTMGFPHNNCGGFCVKAGHAQFQHLLRVMPERYAWHEAQEQALRTYLGKQVAILRDRRGGTVKPLTMAEFRVIKHLPLLLGPGEDQDDSWGGCGCFTDTQESDAVPTTVLADEEVG